MNSFIFSISPYPLWFSMSKLDRLSLLKFLSKPRFAHEVAEYYKISKKLAMLHLKEAVKSGKVLVSDKPVFRAARVRNDKLERFSGFVYVFRNSPMLTDGGARFTVREAGNLPSSSKTDVFSIKFVSKTHKGSTVAERHFKTSNALTTRFDAPQGRIRLAKQRATHQLFGRYSQLRKEEVKSLSNLERVRLFQALLKEPLPFLDLHRLFGVSKQTIRGLVKNGLLMEMWGPKAIGVRFKLTNKGKTYLKRLESTAKIEPTVKRNMFIKLKHRTLLQC